jgi:serine/threonine protein kinase
MYAPKRAINSGNLRQELNKRQYRRLSEPTVRNFFWQICDGVEYLHRNLVVHRDLKLENLLVHCEQGRSTIKIVDFGFAV